MAGMVVPNLDIMVVAVVVVPELWALPVQQRKAEMAGMVFNRTSPEHSRIIPVAVAVDGKLHQVQPEQLAVLVVGEMQELVVQLILVLMGQMVWVVVVVPDIIIQ